MAAASALLASLDVSEPQDDEALLDALDDEPDGLDGKAGVPADQVGIVGGGQRSPGAVMVMTYDSAAMPRRDPGGYDLRLDLLGAGWGWAVCGRCRSGAPGLTAWAARSIINLMVEYSSDRLDRTFMALSDPTRRAILARLRTGSFTVNELAEPFPVTLNAVSKHLKVLERAGLVRREIHGRVHHCYLEAEALHKAAQWLDEYRVFWERSLDELDAFLRRRRSQQGKEGQE